VIFKLIALSVVAAMSGAPAPAPRVADSPRAVVWAVGDGADGSAVAGRMARRIAADDPDRFLYLGDVYPSGTAGDFARNYESTYGPLAPITEPTPGNHDWGNRSTGYFPYWLRKRGRPLRSWYAFEAGGWEILDLNSEAPHGPGSPQLRWLQRQLTEPGTCRLAFWHRPRFSAGVVHGDASDVAPFWQELSGHARLVVNGHEHDLQRQRRRAGLTEYVVGAGGAVRYAVRSDARLAFGRGDVSGALRIVLRPGRARLEFRSVDGDVLDVSRATCSGPVTP
jgi:Calcineurin-like phosphoesterase